MLRTLFETRPLCRRDAVSASAADVKDASFQRDKNGFDRHQNDESCISEGLKPNTLPRRDGNDAPESVRACTRTREPLASPTDTRVKATPKTKNKHAHTTRDTG